MLVVIAGLPGTGKTTLSRRLATEMSAAVVRLDAVETAIVRSGELKPPLGPVGYLVAQAGVTGCLEVGTPVVVDAVSPVAEARAGWRTAAAAAGAPVHVFEVVLNDLGEHRRRVEQRRSDLEGLVVPTWDQVRARDYQPWDVQRDGDRTIIDGSDTEAALADIRARLSQPATADDR
ncbi:MAG: AAA family ATPase [Mycobacteriales bacterium]